MTLDDRLAVLGLVTPMIWVHLVAVMSALLLGAMILWRGKGDAIHRRRGKLWVGLMALGALTSFGIREINPGGFSAIHALSVYVLFALAIGVWAARRGTVRGLHWHHGMMQSTFAAGLVIAGGANFLPERLVGRFVFGDVASIWHYAAAGVSAAIGLWLIWRIFRPTPHTRSILLGTEARQSHEKGPGASTGA